MGLHTRNHRHDCFFGKRLECQERGAQKFMTATSPKSEFITKVEQMLDQYQSLYDGNCPYSLNDQLTLEKIEHFEATANIELPQDYRDFLLHIGDGARQDRQFPLSLSHAKDCLESSLQESVGFAYMSLPFTIENCNQYFGEGFDEMDDDISDEELEDLQMKALQGTLTLHNDGCGYYIVMIVTGELAGKLYYIDTCGGQGAYLVSDSFGEYYLKWLNRKITERLAFLEQHDRFECVITHVKLGGNVRDLHVSKVQDDFSFQFEFYCPWDFMREGGYSEYTKVDDHLVVSLSMEHKSYCPLVLEKLEGPSAHKTLRPLTLVGERSEHVMIGRVNRLFVHDSGETCFPLFVEELGQEILVKGLGELEIAVGDVYRVRGQLNGEVYQIWR